MKKICPLFLIANSISSSEDGACCKEEDCAWWDSYAGRCAILSSAVAE
ncbi:MAG: hypothetical protein WCN99_04535 [bacterium]